jgi:hypothetical protein
MFSFTFDKILLSDILVSDSLLTEDPFDLIVCLVLKYILNRCA